MRKKCQQQGCVKSSRSPTDFCVEHGGGKRCQQDGCSKSARSPTDFCKAHGGGKRCQQDGCSKSAISPTDFCKAHGGGKRCQHDGCSKSAISPTDFCVEHGGGKRCQQGGCSKSAISPTDFCKAHGGGKRCQQDGCSKSARSPTDFCVEHGGGKRCQQDGCSKSAQSPTDFCIEHGGGHRCAGCKLVSVSQQGLKCYTCRIGSPRLLRREMMVETYLKKYDNLSCYSYRDEPLPCAPTRRRPDFSYVFNDRIVFLEVDEDAHRYYNPQCEKVRILELSEQAKGLPIVVIRFNPKKKLLNHLKLLLEQSFHVPLDKMISLEFLGYEQEQQYDLSFY